MSTPLHDILASLGIRTPQQQIQLWTLQKQKRHAVQELLWHFGKKITKAHASQLTKQNITFRTLEQWKVEAKGVKKFLEILKDHKVNSRKLQDILCLFYFRQKRPVWRKLVLILPVSSCYLYLLPSGTTSHSWCLFCQVVDCYLVIVSCFRVVCCSKLSAPRLLLSVSCLVVLCSLATHPTLLLVSFFNTTGFSKSHHTSKDFTCKRGRNA